MIIKLANGTIIEFDFDKFDIEINGFVPTISLNALGIEEAKKYMFHYNPNEPGHKADIISQPLANNENEIQP